MGTIVHLCIFFVLTFYRETTAKLCSMHQPVRMNDRYVCSRTIIHGTFSENSPLLFHIFYFPMTFFTFQSLSTYYYKYPWPSTPFQTYKPIFYQLNWPYPFFKSKWNISHNSTCPSTALHCTVQCPFQCSSRISNCKIYINQYNMN